MKKLPSVVVAVLSISAAAVQATTISFGPVPTARTVKDVSGTQLSTSSLVWTGTFSSAAFSLNSALSLQANVAAVMSAGGWNQFGLDTSTGLPVDGRIDTMGISASGKLGGQVTDNNINIPTQADFFNNKQVYVWIFNAATVGSATEMGIFHATSAAVPWVFPTNAGGIGDSQPFSTSISQSPTIAAIGGFGSIISGAGTIGSPGALQLTNSFNITAVPEPATLIFGLFSGIAAVFSRRRGK